MATPYRPPTSRPSRQVSTRVRPAELVEVGGTPRAIVPLIQPPGRRGSAQPPTTSAKAVSTRTSKARTARRSERVTRSPSRGSTPRSTGLNHASGSRRRVPDGIGKSPLR